MARFDYVQTNFIRGELTPRINGRIDFDGYFDGAADLKNCIVQPFGGALRRSGTRFVAEVADSSKIVRLLPFEVTTSQTYAVEVGPSKFRFYADGERVENGGSPVEVTSSPYTEATLPNLKYTQSADIMYLANPDVQPKELARTSTTPTFSLSDFSFSDGPYLSQNITSTTLDPDGTGTSVTITASATTGINDGNGFQSGDVGRLIRWSWDGGTHWTWYEITAVNSTTSVDATRKGQSPGNHSAASEWRLGAWSDTTGWPAVVTFHDGRLWFGGTNSQPQTVWGSKSGDYTNFAPSDPDDSTVSADAAVTITINNNLVNAVRWFVSTEKGLLVGTSGPEILIRAAVTDQAFGPDNVEAVRQANWGSSADPLPVLVGRSVVFVQRNGRMVREAAFEFSVDGFTFRALNLLSEHLFRQKTDRLAFQRFGLNSIIWALREDGVPLTFTFEKEQKVYAWSPQPTGDVSAEDRVVEDIISLSTQGGGDRVYVQTKQTIDGGTKRYIEYYEDPYEGGDLEDAFFVDCGLTKTAGTATKTFTGLSHLEGETLQVLADGAAHPDVTVSGGQIVLDRTASKIQVGLGYVSRVQTLDVEEGQSGQTTFGKIKRTSRCHILLDETLGAKVGRSGGNLDRIPFRQPSDPMGSAPALFTGIKSFAFPGNYSKRAHAIVEQDQPLPLHVLAITMDLEVHGAG